MSNVDEVFKALKKTYGDSVITKGVHLAETTRIPTGVFEFDLASGGGFPKGRISLLYGVESSLKTTLALKAIASMQKLEPDKKCVFIDVENSYEPAWGEALGVDNEALIYVLPDYAEQVVDIVEALLYAEDVGVIVLDSLAALITTREIEQSAEKADVGGSGLVVGKLYRKVTLGLSRARREGRLPTFIAINQIRYKIGVMFGDPETMPGGVAFKFASALTVRMYGKDVMDKKIHPALPAWKDCSGIIKKWKVPIVARTFEFKMNTIDREGWKVGQVDDFKTVASYMTDMGLLENPKQGQWIMLGEEYKTLKAAKEALLSDPELLATVRHEIIERMKDKGSISPEPDQEEDL